MKLCACGVAEKDETITWHRYLSFRARFVE
ncbi:hypothetical protein ACVWYJ_007428 [Bradyrhizobium sp. USDA 4471]